MRVAVWNRAFVVTVLCGQSRELVAPTNIRHIRFHISLLFPTKGGGAPVRPAERLAMAPAASTRLRDSIKSTEEEAASVEDALRDALRSNAIKIMDLFVEWDENGDHQVSKSEFRKAMAALGFTRVRIDSVFDSLDEDSSGFIDYKEQIADSSVTGRQHPVERRAQLLPQAPLRRRQVPMPTVATKAAEMHCKETAEQSSSRLQRRTVAPRHSFRSGCAMVSKSMPLGSLTFSTSGTRTGMAS